MLTKPMPKAFRFLDSHRSEIGISVFVKGDFLEPKELVGAYLEAISFEPVPNLFSSSFDVLMSTLTIEVLEVGP